MSDLRVGAILGWILVGIVALAAAGLFLLLLVTPREKIEQLRAETGLQLGSPERHLFPQDYQGWAIVRFGTPGGPALETDHELLVFRYPESGVLETSTGWNPGLKHREYFYDGENGLVELASNTRIWGEKDISVRERRDSEVVEHRYAFFVGTRQEYRNAGPIVRNPHLEELLKQDSAEERLKGPEPPGS